MELDPTPSLSKTVESHSLYIWSRRHARVGVYIVPGWLDTRITLVLCLLIAYGGLKRKFSVRRYDRGTWNPRALNISRSIWADAKFEKS